MHNAQAVNDRDVFDDSIPQDPDIFEGCFLHPAIAALRSFNRHFSERSLSGSELLVFLASMAAFNRHTIGGIAILAGRLSDEVLPLLPTKGHEIGAFVLDAAVDEYGLRESVTHVELARNFAESLGLAAQDVETRENACSASIALGDALFSWYRDRPPAFALGVHTASEITSVEEFLSWHDIFLKFPQYGFSQQNAGFEYMRAHYVHEPHHIENSKLCVARYLNVLPQHGGLVREGARRYLTLYRSMFEQLDTRIFG